MMSRIAPWLLVVLLAAVSCAVISWALKRDAAEHEDRAREVEARELESQDLVVAAQTEQQKLRDQVADLEASNSDLRSALDRARKAAPGVREVSVVQASTGHVTASGQARPETTEECPPCLLAEGDTAEIRVDQVELETKAGNHVVVGAAECRRVAPPPETRLAGGPFEASLTTAAIESEAKPDSRGWGVGPTVMASNAGVAYGLAVSAPPLNVFGIDFEVGVAGGVGYTSVQGGAVVLVRP